MSATKEKVNRAARMMGEIVTPFGAEPIVEVSDTKGDFPKVNIQTYGYNFGSDELQDVRKKAEEAGFEIVRWDIIPKTDDHLSVCFELKEI